MDNARPSAETPETITAHVAAALAAFRHPTLCQDLMALKALRRCVVLDDVLHVELQLPFAWAGGFAALREQQSAELQRLCQVRDVQWTLQQEIATLKPAQGKTPLKGVKNIIAVSSGKGGVGKSSTAVNLALALAAEGAKVGLLDADIYGPSIPDMIGARESRPQSPDGQHMTPVMAHGLATNSIGYLVSEDNAMIWRGPMASKALLQLLQETLWPDLDYLVLDMPPGTGDIQLTLAQQVPVTAALIVTTPQDIALLDARKGLIMFEKVSVPVLGVIENMSTYICSCCGHEEPIFGHGGAQKLADAHHTALLGQIPLHLSLREDLDRGEPTVISRPESPFTQLYRDLAGRVAAELYWNGEVIPSAIPVRSL